MHYMADFGRVTSELATWLTPINRGLRLVREEEVDGCTQICRNWFRIPVSTRHLRAPTLNETLTPRNLSPP